MPTEILCCMGYHAAFATPSSAAERAPFETTCSWIHSSTIAITSPAKWHEARLQSSQSPSKLRLDGEKKPAPSHIWLGHSLSSPSSLALARSEASMPVSLVQNEVRGDVTFCHHPVFSQCSAGDFRGRTLHKWRQFASMVWDATSTITAGNSMISASSGGTYFASRERSSHRLMRILVRRPRMPSRPPARRKWTRNRSR
jgi:hypothetical protein